MGSVDLDEMARPTAARPSLRYFWTQVSCMVSPLAWPSVTLCYTWPGRISVLRQQVHNPEHSKKQKQVVRLAKTAFHLTLPPVADDETEASRPTQARRSSR